MTKRNEPVHPGLFVRENVLVPKQLTVVAAAKLCGVGRPAMSNFLNGRAATTLEMAGRVEIAFGIPAKQLLDMQSAYEVAQTQKPPAIDAAPYVAPFLGIRARDLEQWAERNTPMRTRLAVLLRTLVNSSGIEFTTSDFPGNDDAERPGWDGYLDSPKPTRWIPDGRSGWECGTNNDPSEKSNHDYRKSLEATPLRERKQITFVFVTPRHWLGKKAWVEKARAKNHWKDVRAYDSSDLEQWLEQSLPGQVWFANETERPASKVSTLEAFWHRWAQSATPVLSGSLFLSAIEESRQRVLTRLRSPPQTPIVIAADSLEEGKAYVAQMFGPAGGKDLQVFQDRVLLFDEPGVLPQLALSTTQFIPVTSHREVERELAPLAQATHSFVIYPRDAPGVEPDVVLEPLSWSAFKAALKDMECTDDDIARLSLESGHSVTVLRRRLANVPAIKTPAWANHPDIARGLAPFLFAGSWDRATPADQDVLSLLADVPYAEFESRSQSMVSLEDPPVWSVSDARGVVSKIDLLFAVGKWITTKDLQQFFDVAELVLSEDDPTLDLPEGDRWAAGLYGKRREVSSTLRKGLADTLMLLAVHGNRVVRVRTGFDCEAAAARLVTKLLSPFSLRRLEAQDREMPAYAEAAPEAFLSLLDQDLQAPEPATYGLMRPSGADVMGSCPRTGLLWALEGLAWNPSLLPSVALSLAQLAQIEIHDNWINKPINSLQSIFRAWMPQTGADLQTRLRVMQLVSDRFPMVAWRVGMSQLDLYSGIGTHNHKPVWRGDARGHGEPPATWEPVIEFRRHVLNRALNWEGTYSREMISDLVERLPGYPEEAQAQVWELVRRWAQEHAEDADKAAISEMIRVTILSRRGSRQLGAAASRISASAKAARAALEASDVVNRHAWLFRQTWVDLSADDVEGKAEDYEERGQKITALRVTALREIFDERGIAAIIQLAESGQMAFMLGRMLSSSGLVEENDLPATLQGIVTRPTDDVAWSRRQLAGGLLHGLPTDVRERVLARLNEVHGTDDFAWLLKLCPFNRSTWRRVDALEQKAQDRYWSDVATESLFEDPDEQNEAVERLLKAQRPRAAFATAHVFLERIRPEVLYRVLSELPKKSDEPQDRYAPGQHDLEQAFIRLAKTGIFSMDQLAMLEFVYMDVLSRPGGRDYGLPNLGKYVQAHPEFFVQAIIWNYRRDDGQSDPPELQVPPGQAQDLAQKGYKLIENLEHIPGQNERGELEADRLVAWIRSVRGACADLGRLEVADLSIGKLLSVAPVGQDGIWPCEAVRQVLEELHSTDMVQGVRTGRYNARGPVWRGEGGDQERVLATEYLEWSEALQYSHPFVAGELLRNMAKRYEHEAAGHDARARVRRRARD